MALLNKEDQKANARGWYLRNKELQAERRVSRRVGLDLWVGRSGAERHRRVIDVLERLSRDKWLSPDEVKRITQALCKRAFLDPGKAEETIFLLLKPAYVAGLLRGEPPFKSGSLMITDFLEYLKKPKKKPAPMELVILNFQLKEMKTWTQRN